MVYMGSKSRIAKDIVPIIQEKIDTYHPVAYIEPMVGGANIIDKIQYHTKIGFDNNKYLIALLSNPDKVATLSEERLPREEYNRIRTIYRAGNPNQQEEDWYIGAIGFFGSFGGRFFDGGYGGSEKVEEWKMCLRNYLKQAPNLSDVHFAYCPYQNLPHMENCVIYCDPPYTGAKQYDTSKRFNHEHFWQWVKELSHDNIVLVSECQAPEDFEAIWSKNLKYTVGQNVKKGNEKLFIYKGE